MKRCEAQSAERRAIRREKPLPQFEEVAIRASPETLQFGLVFRIDMSAGSGVS